MRLETMIFLKYMPRTKRWRWRVEVSYGKGRSGHATTRAQAVQAASSAELEIRQGDLNLGKWIG